jgi:hypothetical protein
MKTVKIYILIDPRNGNIRYVGKTNQKLTSRLHAHMQDKSSCHKVHWLEQLKKENLMPDIEVIEEVSQDKQWQDVERFWIKHFKQNGHNLTNNTSGGDGVCGLPQETRDKMRLTWLGRKHKPETLIKLSIASKGRKHSEKSKQHMKEIMTGRDITWGGKLSDAVRKLTKEEAKTVKERLDNGELVKDLALEYRMHRTSISKIKKGVYFEKYRNQ